MRSLKDAERSEMVSVPTAAAFQHVIVVSHTGGIIVVASSSCDAARGVRAGGVVYRQSKGLSTSGLGLM